MRLCSLVHHHLRQAKGTSYPSSSPGRRPRASRGCKIAHARKFLEHNDKVQVTVIFRGREMQHQEEGRRVLDAVLAGLAGVGKVERPPAMDGKRMTVLLMPIKAVAKPRVNPAAKRAIEAKELSSD